ncbi:ligase [Aureococcus anophagefferens]|nr:ligase [Aureococcus anophagefferens]
MAIATALELAPGATVLNVMPLFHIHGLAANVLAALAAGACCVAAPGFAALGPAGVLDALRGVDGYSAVPTMHAALLDALAGDRTSSRVSYARNCSAALPPAVAARLEATFGCEAIATYAMTESMPIAANPRGRGRRLDTVGPASGPDVRLLAPHPSRDEVATGEVCVRGACVTAGYERRGDADPNAALFVDGYLRTGDRGTLEADGHLVLDGRFKETINRGGEQLSPLAVEHALASHAAVGSVVAFAAPHARLGEAVGVFVALRPGRVASLGDLRRHAARTLRDAHLPAALVVASGAPLGPTGKALRVGLAARLGCRRSKPSARRSTRATSTGPRPRRRGSASARSSATPRTASIAWASSRGGPRRRRRRRRTRSPRRRRRRRGPSSPSRTSRAASCGPPRRRPRALRRPLSLADAAPRTNARLLCGRLLRRWHAVEADGVSVNPLAYLDLSGSGLAELPDAVGCLWALDALSVRNNRLAALPAAVGRLALLRNLFADGNALEALPVELAQLRRLEALTLNENRLASLEGVLPPSLTALTVDENRLATFPAAGLDNLRILSLEDNALAELPPLPPRLATLSVDGNGLETLELPETIEVLRASRNAFEALPLAGLRRLRVLRVESSGLRALPGGLPDTLAELVVHENRLAALPRLPANLRILRAHKNRLERLPEDLPASLESLLVDTNRLTALPALGPNIETLIVNSNRLAALPANAFPRLRLLTADENEIRELPGELCATSTLEALHLNSNRLRSLPAAVGDLTNLATLNLEYNDLEALPARLPPNLRLLKLSYNDLSTLPPDLANLRFLKGLFLLGNPKLATIPPVTSALAWVDETCPADHLAGAVVRGRCDRAQPFANFHVRRSHRHCVVCFAIGGVGEWGLVLDAAKLDVDVCYLFDLERSSYTRHAAALDAFLANLASEYDAVSFLGSSQGAFGALRHASRATGAVVAFSPWRNDMAAFDAGVFSDFAPTTAPAKCVVGGRNARDVAVAGAIRERLGDAMAVYHVDSQEHGAAGLFPDRDELVGVVRGFLGDVVLKPG